MNNDIEMRRFCIIHLFFQKQSVTKKVSKSTICVFTNGGYMCKYLAFSARILF